MWYRPSSTRDPFRILTKLIASAPLASTVFHPYNGAGVGTKQVLAGISLEVAIFQRVLRMTTHPTHPRDHPKVRSCPTDPRDFDEMKAHRIIVGTRSDRLAPTSPDQTRQNGRAIPFHLSASPTADCSPLGNGVGIGLELIPGSPPCRYSGKPCLILG